MTRAPRSTALLGLACALVLAGCGTWRRMQHYSAGTEALDAGDYARAVAELEHARSLSPHVSEVRNHLGLAYLAQGREAPALRELRSAVELDCNNDAARWNLRALESSLGIGPTEDGSPAGARSTGAAAAVPDTP